jgi:DNA-binding transcriptional LysR family regulator
MHTVRTDLETGRLIELKIDEVPPGGLGMQMSAVYPTASPPGPAGRWLIERLRDCQTSAAPSSATAQLVNPSSTDLSQPPAGKRRPK